MVSFSSSLHAWRADEFWGHCPEYHEFSKMTMLFLTMTFCPPSGVVLAVAHDAASPSKLIFSRKLRLQYLLLLIHNIISLHG